MMSPPNRESSIHTPRYLLRRHLVLHVLERMAPGSFLEVGCGRGELLPWLDRLGYRGVGLEISTEVLPIAQAAVAGLDSRVRVLGDLADVAGREFDYVLSFEVLEHIEDDHGELRRWLEHLRPGGTFVCTVPAHMKLWSASDEAVGHVRRYERGELVALLENSGLHVEMLWSYGYPLVLLTGPLRHLFHRLRQRRWMDKPTMTRTLGSSCDSTVRIPRVLSWAARMLVSGVGVLFHHLGRPLRRTDHGDGYLVVARKP